MEIFEDIGTKMDISGLHEKSSLWRMLLTNTFILPTMLFKNIQKVTENMKMEASIISILNIIFKILK